MHRMFFSIAPTAVLLAVLAPIVSACPTSLNLMPTADLQEPRTLSLDHENQVYTNLYCDDETSLYSIQSGISPRLEAGFDMSYSGGESDLVLNAKYLLMAESNKRPALAIGTQDVGQGSVPIYYLAAAKSAGDCRLHAGAIGDSRRFQLMGGIEVPVNESTSLVADYIAGKDWSAAVGASWESKTGSTISVVYEFADPSADANLVFISLDWAVN